MPTVLGELYVGKKINISRHNHPKNYAELYQTLKHLQLFHHLSPILDIDATG